jgi:hypothetical protein
VNGTISLTSQSVTQQKNTNEPSAKPSFGDVYKMGEAIRRLSPPLGHHIRDSQGRNTK